MMQAPSHIASHIGRRLSERREASGLSQEELAGRLGVSVTELRMFEAGEKAIPPRQLIQAAETLKTSLGGLLEGAAEGGCGQQFSSPSMDLIRFLAMPEAYALVSAFISIPCRTRRLSVVDHARSLGQSAQTDAPDSPQG